MKTRKINLLLRIRPLTPFENNYSTKEEKVSIISITKENSINVDNNHSYTFDKILNVDSSEQEICKSSTHNIISNALNGKICSIFCYGYNCTGKTVTFEQIVSNSMKEIFKSDISNFTLKISFMEYYLSDLTDLLEKKTKLVVNNNVIKDLSEKEIKNFDEFNDIYKQGKKNRIDLHSKNNKHKMNIHVFNSHSVLILNIYKDNSSFAKIFFIDLGGKTKNVGDTGVNLKEITALNTSLDNFNEIIKSLAKKENNTFRQDKFVRVIKECFNKDNYLSFIIHCVNMKKYKNETFQSLGISKFIKKIN